MKKRKSIFFKLTKATALAFFLAFALASPIYLQGLGEFLNQAFSQELISELGEISTIKSSFPSSLLADFCLAFFLLALVFLARSTKAIFIITGAFFGGFYFYWIGLGGLYLGHAELVFLCLFFAMFYYAAIFALIFHISTWLNGVASVIFKVLALCFLPSIKLFGFNYHNWGIFLSHAHFKASELCIFAIFICAILLTCLKNRAFACILSLLLLGFFFELDNKVQSIEEVRVLNTTHLQNELWQEQSSYENLRLIDDNLGYDKVLLLPESAFALLLEESAFHERLKKRSINKAFLLGSAARDESFVYNSAFLYENGLAKRFDKHYLVPFSEETPRFFSYLNDIFFASAPDLGKGEELNLVKIRGKSYVLAICYEATQELLYEKAARQNAALLAMSNNAWFAFKHEGKLYKSHLEDLQDLLMRFYARKYGVKIAHAKNL